MIQLQQYKQLDQLISPTKNIFIPFHFKSNKGSFEYKITYIGKANYKLIINKEKPRLIKTKSKLLEYIRSHLHKNNFKEKILEEASLDIESINILDEITNDMTEDEITSLSERIVESLNIIKNSFQDCVEITKSYIKHYGSNLKYHVGEMLETYMLRSGMAAALMGGEKARYAPLNKLVEAKKMNKDKEHPETIWIKTGWEKGADNKWRFEMDDNKAKIKTTPLVEVNSLGDILDFPLLFKNYPELKDIPVKYLNNTESCSVSREGNKPMMTLNRHKTVASAMDEAHIREYTSVRFQEGSKALKNREYRDITEYIKAMDKKQWYVLQQKPVYAQFSDEGLLTKENVPDWLSGSFDESPIEEKKKPKKKKKPESLWNDNMKIPDWLINDDAIVDNNDNTPTWLVGSFDDNQDSGKRKQRAAAQIEEDMMAKYKYLWKQLKCSFIETEENLYYLVLLSLGVPHNENPSTERNFKQALEGLLKEFNSPDCVKDKEGNKVSIKQYGSRLFTTSNYIKLRGFRQIGYDMYLGPNGSVRTSEGKEYTWYFTSIESLGTVLHETQHLIQWYEGFASGGNTTRIENNYLKKKEQDYSLTYLKGLQKDGISTVTMDHAHDIKDYIKKTEQKTAEKIGFEVYKSLAGEAEARNATRRNKMHPRLKKVAPPSTTEDIDRDRQRVIFEVEDIDSIELE